MNDLHARQLAGSESDDVVSIANRSGGVELTAQEVSIGGDVVGRDKIVQNINHISNLITLTEEEQLERARSIEARHLRAGVTAFIQRLRERAAGGGTHDDNPYRGLLDYRLGDAARFFGRVSATRRLVECLRRGALTVLHAESGAGKTSLLQAGLSPQLLAQGHLPLYVRSHATPPALAIKRTLVPNLNEAPHLAQASLRDFLTQISAILGSQVGVYVLLDQFEEFFTQLAEPERRPFFDELAECIDDVSLNVHWIVALRAEYFSRLAGVPSRLNFFENQLYLDRLTRAEAREVIVKPIEPAGMTIEPQLVNRLLTDLDRGTGFIQPPQIQLVCSALYEEAAAIQRATITEAMYNQHAGNRPSGTAGILHDYLDTVLKSLPVEQRSTARQILEELIASDGQRIRRTEPELAVSLSQRQIDTQALHQILAQLTIRRLINPIETDLGLTYELVHDYLAADLQLSEATRARKAAQELLDQELRDSLEHRTLIGADKLAIIEARRADLVLTSEARALLNRSRRAVQRQQRLMVGGIGAVISLILIAVILTLTAIRAQTAAQVAHQQQVTAENAAATSEARKAAADLALTGLFQQTGIVNTNATAYDLDFDGDNLWVAGVHLVAVNPQSGTIQHEFDFGPALRAVAFDRLHARLWVAAYDQNVLHTIDRATGVIQMSVRLSAPATALALDADHIWAVSGQTLQGINLLDGRIDVTQTLPTPASGLPGALMSAAGRIWIATEGGVLSYDVAANRLAREPTRPDAFLTANALAYDGQHVWAARQASFDRELVAIDPDTDASAVRRLTDKSLQFDFGRISALSIDARDTARLWIANLDEDAVRVFDLSVPGISLPLFAGRDPIALASVGHDLWALSRFDGTLTRIDQGPALLFDVNPDEAFRPVTSTAPARLAPTVNDCTVQWRENNLTDFSLRAAICVDDRVFMTGDRQMGAAVDSVLGEFVPMNDTLIPSMSFIHPGAFTFDGKYVWIVRPTDHTIHAIDLARQREEARYFIAASVEKLAYDGARLWLMDATGKKIQYLLLREQ